MIHTHLSKRYYYTGGILDATGDKLIHINAMNIADTFISGSVGITFLLCSAPHIISEDIN